MMTLFYREWRVFALAVAVIFVTGLASLSTIGRQEDPTITNLFATILTPFPGAGPERVEALITEKIEEELREIPEIDEISSTSRLGISVVSVELSKYISDDQIETAWSEIRDAISDAARLFPEGVPEPEFINNRTGAFTTIVALKYREGAEYRPGTIRRYGELLQDRLLQRGGTKRAETFGTDQEEVQVTLDPRKLAQVGLTPRDVATAIRQADSKVSAGQLRNDASQLLIEVEGEILSTERIMRTPLVAATDGRVLRVSDVATVTRGVRRPASSVAFLEDSQVVLVAAEMEEGLQVDSWMQGVNALYDRFAAELPASLELEPIFDQSRYTTERLSDLVGNLALGVGLVVAVLFFTLGWRGALIVACILPLTTLASLSVMKFYGLPIHQMSVTGLIVALGLLVDAAIVMTDEVRRRLKGQMPRLDSVSSAIKRLAGPLFASTATTVLAFMPMALLPGPAGDFVGAIAIAVIVMLIASFVLALTITPALAGWLLPTRAKLAESEDAQPWWVTGIHAGAIGRWFTASIDWSLKHRGVALFAAVSLPVIGFLAFPTLTAQFFPAVTRDQFYIEVFLEDTASIEKSRRVAVLGQQILENDPAIASSAWVAGEAPPPFYYNMRSGRDGNAGFVGALVTTRDKYETENTVKRMQAAFDRAFPSAQILVRGIVQGPPVDAPVEVRVIGPDIAVLRDLGTALRERMSRSPYFIHTKASLLPAEPKLIFRLDEDKVRLAGLDMGTVASFLDTALEGITGGSMLEGTEELPVRVRFAGEWQAAVEAIGSLDIPLPRAGVQQQGGQGAAQAQAGAAQGQAGARQAGQTGQAGQGQNGQGQATQNAYRTVPLSALGTLDLAASESPIPRYKGERSNLVQGFIPVDILPQEAFDSFTAALEADPVEMPQGYRIEYAGDSDARADTVGNLVASMGLIVVLTVASIVLTFGSFRLSIVAFAVAFLSMGMSLLSLELFGYPFGIQAIIGVIGSIGVSINAAIIIMTALQATPKAVAGDPEAVRDVVLASSRHIVSTTTTTFGGFLPLIIAGGGFWPPFAMAIAGGVFLSTIVSFYFTPPAFLLVLKWGGPLPSKEDTLEADLAASQAADVKEPLVGDETVTLRAV